MTHLISYDIQDDRIRIKVAKTLLRYGLHRIQYSVFMGSLREATLNKIVKQLDKCTRETAWTAEDSILLLPLHHYSQQNVQFFGASPDRWSEITGQSHTLII